MTKNRASIVLLLVAAAGFSVLGLWFSTREDAAREAELAPEAPASTAARAEAPDADLAAPSRRDAVLVADDARAIAAPAATTEGAGATPEVWNVRGTVLDVEGRPAAGLDVYEAGHATAPRARSASDGSFTFSFDGGDLNVAAGGATWATVLEGHASRARAADETLVVVASVVPLFGRVVDEAGAGVEGARVRWELSDSGLARVPVPLDRTSRPYPSVHVSRAGGTFEFDGVPSMPQLVILSDAEGYEPTRETIDTQTRPPSGELRLVLRRTADRSRVVRGVVVHADGSPAGDARVHLSTRSAPTDAAGRFVLAVPKGLEDEQPLVAIATGHQAAVQPGFGRVARAGPYPLAPVRLVLGPAALTIRGRVLDAEDRPLAGWRITLSDGTGVSRGRVPAITAEDLTAGGSAAASTNANGAFVVEGLFDRAYRIAAYDPTTLVRVESDPVQAGAQDVVLRRPADALLPEVTGTVVGRNGTPIAGASVGIGVVTAEEGGAKSWINGATTRTAADGTFVLKDVPARFAHLDVSGEDVIPTTFVLADLDPRHALRLQVTRRGNFRIEGLPPSTDTRWLVALDARGEELSLWEFQANGWSSTNRLQLTTETTRVYAVSETVTTLVLYQPYDKEIARRPLSLVASDVTVVRW